LHFKKIEYNECTNFQKNTNIKTTTIRKAKNLNQAYKEIEKRLSEGLSFKINTVIVEENVNILTVVRKNDSLKKEKDIPSEAMNLYLEMDYIISLLEEKSGRYFMADNSAKEMFVYNNEIDWKKLDTATTDDLIDFLKRRGLDIRIKKKKIKLLKLNNKI
jgi:hypothetical protein